MLSPRLKNPRAAMLALAAAAAAAPEAAQAAPALPGATMTWPWAMPFAGLLLTIALGPLFLAKIWHNHYAKFAALWAVIALAPIAAFFGMPAAAAALTHAMLGEYFSFIVVLFALYTTAGGILVSGDVRATPALNTMLLAFGALIASVVGTTGAAMILIRPVIRANEGRRRNAHVIVFFIILVANIGGALTPLGDPPLFVGFLRGVEFFWTARHLWPQTALAAGVVLLAFFVFDTLVARRDREPRGQRIRWRSFRVSGLVNLVLIAGIIGAILLSAAWKPGLAVMLFGTTIELQNAARDGALIVIALLSLWLTPDEHRQANGFSWAPIREVAILFAAIFVAIAPVLAMLQAGRDGTFAFLLEIVTRHDGAPHQVAYFWLTGLLSAFLDNAPTYLVFFELAGGDAPTLMGPLAGTLAGISMGAVFMGALTYIGNAPNFMVYAIAEERGIRMPSFFGYMVWAAAVLVPVFVLLTVLPLAPVLNP
jgi:Na+/H+ antiporter NhaD/arsenite permease-like protein